MTIQSQLDASVGPKFLSISNLDIRRTLSIAAESAFGSSVELTETRPKRGSGCIWTVDVPGAAVDIPELGGRLTPRLWARNANDGSASFSIGLGMFVWVCTNGLFVGVSDMVQRIRHVDGPKARSFLDILPEQFSLAATRLGNGELIDHALDARDTQVLDPLTLLAQLPGLSRSARQRALYQVATGSHREKDQPTNAWGLYNLVNEATRRSGRSAFAAADRDMGLLGEVLILAEDQLSQATQVA